MDPAQLNQLASPIWVVSLVCAALALLFGPRKWVFPVLLVLSAFFSYRNRTYVLGLNFFTARILLLVGWVRIFARREYHGFQIVPLDKAWILFCLWSVIAETIRRGGPGLVFGVANAVYDGLGTYFLARICLLNSNLSVLRRLIICLGGICLVLATSMLAEYFTQRNWLAPLAPFFQTVQERAGRMRCQATFGHPVLAGTYGAVLLPLFAAFWWQPRMRKLAFAGAVASVIMVVTAGSGGPFMTFVAVLFAVFLWPLRASLRPIRWAVVSILILLHLVMNAPVWALIARLHVVAGASSYHRFLLIDSFINHFRDWWLIGTEDTGDWGFETDDVANGFCIVAKHAGLLGLILFIRVLWLCFREIGLRRRDVQLDRPMEIIVWAFGASLFAHVVTFFGTSYFDQTIVLWHVTLAMLASLPLLIQKPEETLKLEAIPLSESMPAETLARPIPGT